MLNWSKIMVAQLTETEIDQLTLTFDDVVYHEGGCISNGSLFGYVYFSMADSCLRITWTELAR
jgi:hypothetical protein